MKHQREMIIRQQELAAKEESLRALETRLGKFSLSQCGFVDLMLASYRSFADLQPLGSRQVALR
jgi:hypothetical protein